MKLEQAQRVAEVVRSYMQPWCTRIEVAGSVRRERPDVKDLEICAIPFWGVQTKPGSLFGETEGLNTLWKNLKSSEFIEWIKPATQEIVRGEIKPEGKYWRGLIKRGRFDSPEDIKLDLFLPKPENWGVIFTIRTGSADFSRALVTHARDKTPYCVEGGWLTDRTDHPGKRVECREEEELFSMIDLEWIHPRDRHDDNSLRRVIH